MGSSVQAAHVKLQLMAADRTQMPDDPPPFLGSWRKVYTFVLGYLALLIVSFFVGGCLFVLFYFGLPTARVTPAPTVLPRFYPAKVYPASESLEQPFNAKTGARPTVFFPLRRALAVGIPLYPPAIVLSVI